MAGSMQDMESKFPKNQRSIRNCVQMDSDYSWFNNPQFRIKIHKKTRLYISLA